MLAAYLQYWRINLLTMLEYRANFHHVVRLHDRVSRRRARGALRDDAAVSVDERLGFPADVLPRTRLWMTGHELHNALFFNVVSVPEYVREGRFDRFLVRPLDTLFQVLTVPQQIFPDGLMLAIVTLASRRDRRRARRLALRGLRPARSWSAAR